VYATASTSATGAGAGRLHLPVVRPDELRAAGLPAIQSPLVIDENVRGASFYASTTEE